MFPLNNIKLKYRCMGAGVRERRQPVRENDRVQKALKGYLQRKTEKLGPLRGPEDSRVEEEEEEEEENQSRWIEAG